VALIPGSRLGPYEVLGPLGAGGMGEVYRARDSRLQRDVALKVLPEAFAADPERLARFEREAQALAALKHPHIATIYGMHDERGEGGAHVRALVLEVIEGETLAERMERGPIPVEEAVAIARQIADALEAAHEQGIIHRDLKPANVKITPEGTVKVLDFGLAKLQAAEGRDASSLSMSPTMTSPVMVTGVSVLLGTAGYMAPEQARGKAVDKRADIWAFGVVLYEMLSGRRAFDGESVTDVIAAIIHKDVDWSALPAATPVAVRTVLRQCLQKDPKQRLRDMGDVRLLLDGALASPEPAVSASASSTRRGWLSVAVPALVAAAIAGVAVWLLARPEPPVREALRFEIGGRAARGLGVGISPDGKTVGFFDVSSSTPALWVHSLETGEAREVPGLTFGGRAGPPITSPDGRTLAIWIDGKIKRVDMAGGAAETLADAPNYAGGTWSSSNVILFADGRSIKRVPVGGGTTVTVTALDEARQETGHALPSFLPDGQYFLYRRNSTDPGVSGVYVGRADASPEEQDRTRLLATDSQVAFTSPDGGDDGYVLFLRDNLLTAQPFDARARRLTGEPITVLTQRIASQGGFAMFSVSNTGTLAYRAALSPVGTVVALNRSGQRETLVGGAKLERASNPRLSPDGRRLVAVLAGDLWVYDLDGRPPIKLTFDGNKFSPLWTADGTRIVYEQGGARGPVSVFSIPADGSGGAPAPIAPEGHFHPHGWAANGDLVAVRLEGGDIDLVRFAPRADGNAETVQETPAIEGLSAAVSSDGRWLAYTADSTGRSEIWVRLLTAAGPAVRVSPNGGSDPVWARNGRELYYREGDKMMAVAVDAGPAFNFKPPIELFTAAIASEAQPPHYDVTSDGRFVFIAPDDARDVPISIILNWTELLRNRAAAQ
jgi:Tol biopolymer transport system component